MPDLDITPPPSPTARADETTAATATATGGGSVSEPDLTSPSSPVASRFPYSAALAHAKIHHDFNLVRFVFTFSQ